MDTRRDAIAVPQRAVFETQGLFQLAVVADDGTVELRRVEMGPRFDNEWIVDSGLEPGERILASGDDGFLWGCGFSMPYSDQDAVVFEAALTG